MGDDGCGNTHGIVVGKDQQERNIDRRPLIIIFLRVSEIGEWFDGLNGRDSLSDLDCCL
jgi:hypothetical protein